VGSVPQDAGLPVKDRAGGAGSFGTHVAVRKSSINHSQTSKGEETRAVHAGEPTWPTK